MFLQVESSNRRQFLVRSVLGAGSVLFLPALVGGCIADHDILGPDISGIPPVIPRETETEIDWNDDAKIAVVGGLKFVPEVGEILSVLVEIFWPNTKVNVWDEVKDKVEAFVDQKITDNIYSTVSEDLEGLKNVSHLYLNSVKNGNPTDINIQWIATRTSFASALPHFQAKASELPLLGLFAQFANMYLALLRDAVINGKSWGRNAAEQQQDVADLKKAIKDFSDYTAGLIENQMLQLSFFTPVDHHRCEPFRTVNNFVRNMTLAVLDFRVTWPFYDVTLYPNGTEVELTREIYSDPYGTCDDSGAINLSSPPTQFPTNLTVWGYNAIDAVQLTYPTGSGPGGVTQTKRMGDSAGGINVPPYGGSFTISPENPITRANVSAGDIVNALVFVYHDGSNTDVLGGRAGYGDGTSVGYVHEALSRVHINGVSDFYGSADCIVFGFKFWQAPAATLNAMRAIYIRSPKERTAADFAQAFPNVAIPGDLITTELKAFRDAHWAHIEASAKAPK